MATELATAYVSLTVSARGIKNEIDREVAAPLKAAAKQGEKDISQSAKSAAGAHQTSAKLAAAAWAGAGVGLAATAKSAVSAFSTATGEVAKLQRLTGGSAEDLSKLRGAAKLVNIDTDKLGRGIVLLSKQAAAGKLDDYGISMKNAAGEARPFGDVLGDVAEKIKDTPAGFERNALAVKLFGRSGTDLIPILKGGRDGLRELTDEAGKYGAAISEQDIAANKAFLKSQRELGLETEKLKVNLGRELIPVVKGVEEVGLKAAAGLDAIPGPIKTVVGVVGGLAVVGGVAGKGLGFVGDGLSKIKDLGSASVGGLKDVVNGLRGVESAGAAAAAGETAAAGGLTGFLNPAVLGGAAVLVGGIAIYEKWAATAAAARKAEEANAKGFVNSGNLVASAQKALQNELNGTREGTENFSAAWRGSGLIVGQVAKDLAHGADFDLFKSKLNGVGDIFGKLGRDSVIGEKDLRRIAQAAKESGPEVAKHVATLTRSYRAEKITANQFRDNINALSEVAKGYNLAGQDVGLYAGQLRDLIKDKGQLSAADQRDIKTARDTSKHFDERQKALDRLTARYPELAKEIGLEDAASRKAAESEQKHTASLKDIAAGIEHVGNNLKLQAFQYQASEAAASGYVDSVNRLTPNRKLVDTSVSVSKATRDLVTNAAAVAKLPASLDPVTLAFADLSDEQTQALQLVETYGDAAHASIARFVASGNTEKATAVATLYREQLDKVLRSAGLSEEAIAGYNEELGLTPATIETSIKLAGMEQAKFQFDTLFQLLGVDPGLFGNPDQAELNKILNLTISGDVAGAVAEMEKLRHDQESRDITIRVTTQMHTEFVTDDGVDHEHQAGRPVGGTAPRPAPSRPNADTRNPDQSGTLAALRPYTAGMPVRDFTDSERRQGLPQATLTYLSQGNWLALLRDIRIRGARYSLPGFARGGVVPGSGTGDTVKALLTPGEFVLKRAVVDQVGVGALEDLNAGRPLVQRFAQGGLVQGAPMPVAGPVSASSLLAGNENSFLAYLNQALRIFGGDAKDLFRSTGLDSAGVKLPEIESSTLRSMNAVRDAIQRVGFTLTNGVNGTQVAEKAGRRLLLGVPGSKRPPSKAPHGPADPSVFLRHLGDYLRTFGAKPGDVWNDTGLDRKGLRIPQIESATLPAENAVTAALRASGFDLTEGQRRGSWEAVNQAVRYLVAPFNTSSRPPAATPPSAAAGASPQQSAPVYVRHLVDPAGPNTLANTVVEVSPKLTGPVKPRPDLAYVAMQAFNDIRQSHGVAPVLYDQRYSTVSQSWAQKLASASSIFHTRNLHEGLPGKQVVSEIVDIHRLAGRSANAGDAAAAIKQYVSSAPHLKAIVTSSYRAAGPGFAERDGFLFNATRMGQILYGAAAAPAAPRYPRQTNPFAKYFGGHPAPSGSANLAALAAAVRDPKHAGTIRAAKEFADAKHLPVKDWTHLDLIAEVFGYIANDRRSNLIAATNERKGRYPLPGFALGGLVPGVGAKDTVRAVLTPGEFVVTAKGVASVGIGALEEINAGRPLQAAKEAVGYSTGGLVTSAVRHQDGPALIFSPRWTYSHPATSSLLEQPSWARPLTAEEMGVVTAPTSGPASAGGKVVNQTNHITMPTVTPTSVAVELPGVLRAAARELG